jgi:hypothetical protein
MSRITTCRFFLSAILCACALLAWPSANSASASAVTIVQVTVSNGTDSGSQIFTVPSINSDPFSWTDNTPVAVNASTGSQPYLGTINSLTLWLNDPTVSLGFAVTAGPIATTFSISSITVSFPPLVNPGGFASASMTLTSNPPLTASSVTGLFPGSKAYQAQYNGATGVFANLVSPLGTTTSTSGSEQFPVVPGYAPIVGTVSDIESQFWFTLSSQASASGTSSFVVVPEPSSVWLALAGLSTLSLLRASRQRTRT